MRVFVADVVAARLLGRRLGVDRVIKSHCFAFSEHEIITLNVVAAGPMNGLYTS
jgi:hypothetical protein